MTRAKGRVRESPARRTRKGEDVGSPSPRAAPWSPQASRRRLCCIVACSRRGDRELAPIGRLGGPVPFRAVETRKREGSFGSRPVLVPGRPETNAHSSFHPDWKRATTIHPEQANPEKTNEALLVPLCNPALSY